MTATDTEAALLAAIRENPGDIARRMVYADALADAGRELDAIMHRIIAEPGRDEWRLDYAAELERAAGEVVCESCKGVGRVAFTEEAAINGGNPFVVTCRDCRGTGRASDGRAELAAFVRVQVELAARDDERCRCRECQPTGQHHNGPCRSPLKPLRTRERELWPAVRGMFAADGVNLWCGRWPGGNTATPAVLVSRGLPAVVRCTLAEWMGGECERCGGHGDIIVEDHLAESAYEIACPGCHGTTRVPAIGPRLAQRWPIERVEVTPESDWMTDHGEAFGREHPDLRYAVSLPEGAREPGNPWPDRMFATIDEAREWFGDWLLAWARGQAV